MGKLIKTLSYCFVGFFTFSLLLFPQIAFADDQILFSDDFSSGNLNQWHVELGNWTVNNGSLYEETLSPRVFGSIVTGSTEWNNYRLEADVNYVQGIDQGIGVRRDPANGNFYQFTLRYGTGWYSTPEIILQKIENNVATSIADTHSVSLNNNSWYKLKIEVNNSNIKLYVNNSIVFDINDTNSKITKGSIAFQSWSGDIGVSKIYIDNVKVTSLNPPKKTPLIFIPGIAGSELKTTAETHWSEADGHGGTYQHTYPANETVWVNTNAAVLPGSDDYFDILRLNSDGINSVANLDLTGNYSAGAYDKTIQFLTSNDYTLNKDLFIFPYDWRKDLTLTKSYLDQKITTIKQQTGSNQVDIVAHSMGGLVARNYISDTSKAPNVRKLITLGTPYLGSVQMLKDLMYGDCLKFDIKIMCLSIPPEEFKDVIQNMSGVYQLMPSQKYYQFYTGNNIYPFPYDNELDNNLKKGQLDYSKIKIMLFNLKYNTNLFTFAESFHNLDSNLNNTNGVDTTIIVGSGISTIGQIIDKYSINFLGIKIPKHDYLMINGDEAVPLYSASLNDTSRNISLSGNTKVYYAKQSHGNLPLDNSVLQMVLNTLQNINTIPKGISNQPFGLNGKVVSVHSPVNLHIYDKYGNHTGPTVDGNYEENIPGSIYQTLDDAKFIYLPEDGQYAIKLEATDQGSFDFKIQDYESDVLNQTILFKNIPLMSSTKATAQLDTYNTNKTTLLLDKNGDGNDISQIIPTSVLNEDANFDTTPPQTSEAIQGTKGNNNWYKSFVKLTLTAEDAPKGSGILKTEYSLDGKDIQQYNNPILISDDGIHTIKFRSIDNAGNEENIRTIEIKIDTTSPQLTLDTTPKFLWPANGKMIDVTILGNSSDQNLLSTTFLVTDEYGLIQPVITDFGQIIQLEAKRNGSDKDGRIYTILATSEDYAGNITQKITKIIVPHDLGY